MKTKLLIVLAAVAMLFTACKKEEQTLADNTIVYDGKTYQMETILGYINPELSFLCASNEAIGFDGYHMRNDPGFLIDVTYDDLTKQWPFFQITGVLAMDTEAGELDGEQYGFDSTVFESGTAKQTYANKTLSLELNSKLKNGKDFALKLTLTSDWFAY